MLNLPALRDLNMSDNPLAESAILSQFTNLTSLTVGRARVTNLVHFAGLRRLLSLEVWENGVTDISPLGGLTNLVRLDVSWNKVTNFAQLRHCGGWKTCPRISA